MVNNESIIEKLTDMKNSILSLVEINEKIQNIEEKLDPAKNEMPGFPVFLIYIAIYTICIYFMPKNFHKTHTIIFLFSLVIIFFAASIFITSINRRVNFNPNKSQIPELESEMHMLENDWNETAFRVYNNDIIPQRYLHPDYIDYMIECLKYDRVKTIGEALNLLDSEIKHEQTLETFEMIEKNNQIMYDAIQQIGDKIGDKIDQSNEHLKTIRKDISWTAYNTSALKPRSYVGKAIDDIARH